MKLCQYIVQQFCKQMRLYKQCTTLLCKCILDSIYVHITKFHILILEVYHILFYFNFKLSGFSQSTCKFTYVFVSLILSAFKDGYYSSSNFLFYVKIYNFTSHNELTIIESKQLYACTVGPTNHINLQALSTI